MALKKAHTFIILEMIDLKGKNILVAGGTGLVGVNLTVRLSQLGAKVFSTYFSRNPQVYKDKYRHFDFTQYPDCLEATKGMDYMVICAAYSAGVGAAKEDSCAAITGNLRIISGLLEAAKINKLEKVIVISSSTVYQEKNSPMREDDLDLNKPPYELYMGIGWLNRYIEKLALFYHKQCGIKVGIIRPANIYGPYDKFDDAKSNVLPALIKRALNKENPYVVWGNGSVVRDFIYVEDFLDCLLNVLDKYCVAEPINISTGKGITIGEAVKTILQVCGHNACPRYDSSRPVAVPYRVLSPEKYEAIFGKLRLTPFAEGIATTVEWYRSINNS